MPSNINTAEFDDANIARAAEQHATEATAVMTAVTKADSPPVPEDESIAQSPERAEVLAMVATGIAGYAASNRDTLIQRYTEDCTRHRNRYGKQSDCPGFDRDDLDVIKEARDHAEQVFAVVTRDADQARMSRKLEQQDDYLRELMQEEGPVAKQAQVRWQLNRQYIAYLNGNVHPELTFRAQTAMSNDYGRTITPQPFQFRCKVRPCVYEYTGFEVKRPANYVEQKPALEIMPPLFTGSKN